MNIRFAPAPQNERKTKPDENRLAFGQYFSDHMFVMTFDADKGWHDGTIKKYQPFSLDPSAMVLHYGQAIFEGLKAYRGDADNIFLFRPKANLERMNISAERMCMPPIRVDEVCDAMKELIRLDREWVPRSQGATLYVRPTMIATESALGVRAAKQYLFFIIFVQVVIIVAPFVYPVIVVFVISIEVFFLES